MTETDWIATGSIAAVVTALGTVVMAVAIALTALYAKGTLQATRDDSRARTRPVVVAELRRELLSRGTILLVLKNMGSSIARDVVITFDPPPPADVAGLPESDMMKWVYERYSSPITTWAPGWMVSNVVRVGDEELNAITVTAAYNGPDGEMYEDAYDLKPEHILKETQSGPSETKDPVKLEQQKLKALHALVRTIRSM